MVVYRLLTTLGDKILNDLLFSADDEVEMEWMETFIDGVKKAYHPLTKAVLYKMEVVETTEILPENPAKLVDYGD